MVEKRHKKFNPPEHRKQRGGKGELSLHSSQLGDAEMIVRRPPTPKDSAFGARLFAVEEDMQDLKASMNEGFRAIQAKLDERSKIPWPGLTLILMFVISVSALAYWPIREQQTLLRDEIKYQTVEGLARDRRFLDMIIKVQLEVSEMRGARSGRN